MAKELVVLVNDEVLGTVYQLPSGRLGFQYDNDWLDLLDAFPLSMSMPLGQKEHTHNVVHAYLSGLLPDSDETRKAIARHYKISTPTTFKLISAKGEDLPGAVQIVPPDRIDKLKGRGGAFPVSEQKLADHLESIRAGKIGQLDVVEDAGRFSLAGMQAKVAVYWVNGKWHLPSGRTPSTHIVKPPIPWLEGQVENEHFCLRLAKRLGLPTAESTIVEIGGKPNIVVARYDRLRVKGTQKLKLTEPGGTVVRVHQEDMCQAHAVEPDRKYQSDGGPGIKKIMQLLSGSSSPTTDRNRFMRACAFNYIILGTDAHAKNYSILIQYGQYRLAPLYDINSVIPYSQEMLNSRTLAMSVGNQNKWRAILPSDWKRASEDSGYPFEDAQEHLKDMIRRAPDLAQSVRQECQKDGLKSPTITRLAAGIAKRCASLRKLYGF